MSADAAPLATPPLPGLLSHATPVALGASAARPLDERLAAYRREPEVADALARMERGDIDEAVSRLRARRERDPRDGLAAYHLGLAYQRASDAQAAVREFERALAREPELASDPSLTRATVAALRDERAAGSAESLLRSAPLAQSAAAAAALADEAIDGPVERARGRAARLAQDRAPLLGPLPRARVRLRTVVTCEELQDALATLSTLGPGGAQEDVRRVSAGECSVLPQRRLCRECSGEDGADRRALERSAEHPRGRGHGRRGRRGHRG